MIGRFRVPDALAHKARAGGAACIAWLEDLPELVADVALQWQLSVGEPMPGGTASLVVPVTLPDGEGAVLKLAMPAEIDGWQALDSESRVLAATGGAVCVAMLAYDPDRHAMLTELLGPSLFEIAWPLERQLGVICRLLQQLWSVPADFALPTGADKARGLESYITDAWERLGRPCPGAVIDQARVFASRRAAAFRPDRSVLLHGDAHAWNTLQDLGDLGDGERFRFIDPDGLFGEREYDLAISMREYDDDLFAGDPLARGRGRARFLADQTGTDPQAIWEWGYIERVSNGLLLIDMGKSPEVGRICLRVAEAWAATG